MMFYQDNEDECTRLSGEWESLIISNTILAILCAFRFPHSDPNARTCIAVIPSTHLFSTHSTTLVIALVPEFGIALSLCDDLVALPFLGEACRHLAQIRNDILAALHDRILGRDSAVSGDTKIEGREERVRNLVCGEVDVRVLEEALRDQIAEGVVFFVEGEDLGVGNLCS